MNKKKMTIEEIKLERDILDKKIQELVKLIGPIPIGNSEILPYGWRKAAKGRTVWRIIEEVISQNLEKRSDDLGFDSVSPAESEVGVWDFKFVYDGEKESYVNIKSSVLNGRRNKDDISKALGLKQFYSEHPDANIYIATFVIDFKEDMTVEIVDSIVFPVAWIPDIYVNPSNNGNLQSAYYKNLDRAICRTNEEFLVEFQKELLNAEEKRRIKMRRN